MHDNIKWSFNPPTASHHGGAWESTIKLIRKVLTSVLHQQTLTDEVLVTVLCEAEAILNNLPLTKQDLTGPRRPGTFNFKSSSHIEKEASASTRAV